MGIQWCGPLWGKYSSHADGEGDKERERLSSHTVIK